jgi:hypothetical protein
MKPENFSLPPGWEVLRQPLMKKIEAFEAAGGVVRQVKEKLGDLRVYSYRVASEDFLDVSEEEWAASTLCVECGQPSVGFQKHGWIGPRCTTHLK